MICTTTPNHLGLLVGANVTRGTPYQTFHQLAHGSLYIFGSSSNTGAGCQNSFHLPAIGTVRNMDELLGEETRPGKTRFQPLHVETVPEIPLLFIAHSSCINEGAGISVSWRNTLHQWRGVEFAIPTVRVSVTSSLLSSIRLIGPSNERLILLPCPFSIV